MNKPARRDGTPERKNSQRPRRASDARAGSSRTADGRRGAPTAGQPGRGAGKSTVGRNAPNRNSATRNAGAQNGAAKNKKGKAKSPKPTRAPQAAPTISNAKPARHQHGPSRPVGGHAQGEGVRLQKVLAQAGVASRRAAEEMIDAGRVEVDGRIVAEQGLRVDPENAVIRVDGVRVVVQKDLVHLALNKPRGWQSTMSDDLGRPCVGDIVSERVAAGQRLFHVGRLDADTEGLLLLTNDGDLAHRLMHPSFEVAKTYLATVSGQLQKGVSKTLREGVELEDGPAKVDRFTLLDVNEGKSLVRVTLHEGRKHIVRRLFDAVGYPVVRLVRTDIGPVALGDQRPGTLRVLGRGEVGGLYEGVGL
ncbi:pseudouridine synthase [Rhodococcus sp. HNM0569]|uniref:pseudouridine synthase n=1 Tax=Rhodococcus sp. HNM0569 TaxID=2716340 RepID=UPI00146C0708|nr:pseudouridine synthase [Rhodococcus sp. HNM0569]NLU85125.1 rRNA pseudouridine synthase [Rhodococcus sp. HNM0569]